uniref:Uncharacterized protein n=1 Tax=Chlamydomonas leiostraca TaxID=1034604 RepID=A0A7S0RPI0_9CHLO|mmetsp:Transcript_28184/g.71863  ORF Transcript_28184/g.71863 Transcript_28184/m.71863 type:complete len:178 (+) Transcript_28184:127-660(+)
MAQKKDTKFAGLLDDLSGSGSDSESEEQEQEEQQTKKPKKEITVEDLQRVGFKGGPSVLHMKAPQDQGPQNWNWSDGRQLKNKEEEETLEERRQTQERATVGVEQTAMFAQAALTHAERMREEKRLEKELKEKEKRLSFNQKEKRKRDSGQQARGKNYVEEEKRLARSVGVYTGFDT